MNLFTKRIGLLLTAVVGVGAIAALSIGASFSLFSATSPGVTTTFTAGTVTLGTPAVASCPVGNLEPGDSGTCTFTVTYTGSLPAYIGAEATATGVLQPELSFTVNGTPEGSTPVLIGNTGQTGDSPYVTSFTANVGWAFSSAADNSYQGQSAIVTVTFYAVQCSYNGSVNSTQQNGDCSQAGPNNWANSPGVLYNSRIDAPTYQASLCFYCIQMGEIGNEISLANGGGPLSSVVVDMANFTAATSGDTSGSANITLNIYSGGAAPSPSTLIATDTENFTLYATPTGYDPTATNPGAGIDNFSITFDNFTYPVTGVKSLPGTVIYGLQYDDPQGPGNGGLNVQLATEAGPDQVSVGADTYPGYVFTSLASVAAGNGYGWGYNDVGVGEVTCSTVSTTFAQYPTATCDGGLHGLYPYVPAVQFNS